MTQKATGPGHVMISAFEGWNDACQSSTDAVRYLVNRYGGREVRHINADGYYDYQSTRPLVCYATGRRRIIWPQTTFYDIEMNPGCHVIAQIAPEPNYRWKEYCLETLRIADELDVTHIVTTGAMFADCPHTRDLPLDIEGSGYATDPDQRYSGPVGIPTILDAMSQEEGFDTTSMWVSIPQYLADDECEQATLQLLEELSRLLGVSIDVGPLPSKATEWKEKASDFVSRSADLAEYVRRLEYRHDHEEQVRRETSLDGPVCERLIKEAEDFLKNLD